MSIAYIALGSNLGNKNEHLRQAIAALEGMGHVAVVSSFYETAPVGTVPQPDFLNAVAELRTNLPPEELLAALLRIEQREGRDRSAAPPKGPRTLDLDLLAYDEQLLETPTLTLPHPAMAERRFVLEPLAEIAPGWRHPVTGKTAAHLLERLREENAHLPSVQDVEAGPRSS